MTATSPAVTIVADGRVDERETKTPAETRDARESASSDDDGGDAESESESESESEFEDEAVDAVRATLDRQGLGDDDDVVADDVDERDTRVRLLLIRERDAEFAADRSFKSRSLTDLNNEAV
jgi:protein arginine N-methyltransferase 7